MTSGLSLCPTKILAAAQSDSTFEMPVTFWTFLVGTLALCGVPPFSGFYSKDAILAQAWDAHNYPLFAVAVFVAVAVQALPFLALGVTVSGAIAAFVPPGFLPRLLPKRPALAVPIAAAIARRYLSLVEDPGLARHYFGLIEDGWKAAHDADDRSAQ